MCDLLVHGVRVLLLRVVCVSGLPLLKSGDRLPISERGFLEDFPSSPLHTSHSLSKRCCPVVTEQHTEACVLSGRSAPVASEMCWGESAVRTGGCSSGCAQDDGESMVDRKALFTDPPVRSPLTSHDHLPARHLSFSVAAVVSGHPFDRVSGVGVGCDGAYGCVQVSSVCDWQQVPGVLQQSAGCKDNGESGGCLPPPSPASFLHASFDIASDSKSPELSRDLLTKLRVDHHGDSCPVNGVLRMADRSCYVATSGSDTVPPVCPLENVLAPESHDSWASSLTEGSGGDDDDDVFLAVPANRQQGVCQPVESDRSRLSLDVSDAHPSTGDGHVPCIMPSCSVCTRHSTATGNLTSSHVKEGLLWSGYRDSPSFGGIVGSNGDLLSAGCKGNDRLIAVHDAATTYDRGNKTTDVDRDQKRHHPDKHHVVSHSPKQPGPDMEKPVHPLPWQLPLTFRYHSPLQEGGVEGFCAINATVSSDCAPLLLPHSSFPTVETKTSVQGSPMSKVMVSLCDFPLSSVDDQGSVSSVVTGSTGPDVATGASSVHVEGTVLGGRNNAGSDIPDRHRRNEAGTGGDDAVGGNITLLRRLFELTPKAGNGDYGGGGHSSSIHNRASR